MKNGKFLSDVLDTSCFRCGALNLITAPCGCGKTSASINKIAPLASCPRKAIYLIDTQKWQRTPCPEPGPDYALSLLRRKHCQPLFLRG